MSKPRSKPRKPAPAWSPPVAHLLTLGFPGIGDGSWRKVPFADYAAMGLTEAHAPELRRLMFDTGLHADDLGPAGFGPVHAARALAVLAPPGILDDFLELTRKADRFDFDWWLEDTPNLLARLGEPAVEPLARVARDSREPFGARLFWIDGLERLADEHPTARARVVAIFIDMLRYASLTHEGINGSVVSALLGLRAEEALPAIRAAYATGHMDEMCAGSLEQVEHWMHISPEQAAEEDRAAADKAEAELEARFAAVPPEEAAQALVLEAMEKLRDYR